MVQAYRTFTQRQIALSMALNSHLSERFYIVLCTNHIILLFYFVNFKLSFKTFPSIFKLVQILSQNIFNTSLSPIRRGFAPGFVHYKKGAFDMQPQVITFTSCLPIVGGSLRLLPPLKLVALKYC